jgi:RNA polymerase sigma factor (TIGR02999 family)
MTDQSDRADPAADTALRLQELLPAAAAGDRRAFDEAYALLYQELARLARAQRARWRGNETLDTTVLVHEAYLKLAASSGHDTKEADRGPRWESRRHFFALAAQVMRQVLVNYAEARRAAKRGGDRTQVPLEVLEWMPEGNAAGAADEAEADRILGLHRALERLAARAPRQARIVECRFFAGLSIPETAEALGVSPATVKRDWQAASDWLARELVPSGTSTTTPPSPPRS